MIPAPLQPVPRSNIPPYGGRIQPPEFPPNWDPFARLEYDERGFLFPCRRSMIERGFMWIIRKLGWRR
jgi:hypothetical protein